MKRTISHRKYLIKNLAKPGEAAAYLDSVAEDGDLKALLKAVRNVVAAGGGMGRLAAATGMSRTSLYKTLSASGNPEVGTLEAILQVYGIRLGFMPTEEPRPAARPASLHGHYMNP